MIDASDVLARFARPEYTGENRCSPCTAVNVAIAIGLAIGLGVVGSAPVGALAFAVFLAIIYLRGYLIPGTPALTRRYFPASVLSWFGKAPERGWERPTIETADFEDAVAALSTADVVIREAGDVRLTVEFRARWRDRLDRETNPTDDVAAPDADAIAAAFDADTVDRRGDATVEFDGDRLVRWESDAALAADVAADRELRDELDGWAALDPDDRRDVLAGLRLLRERCPACDGRLDARVERLEHCCRRPKIAIDVACEACGRSIVSLAVPESSPVLEWVPDRAVSDA
ncbi:hypothetical protein [Halosolutus gelatinilyticus]|uniref:hypothetical protein n=1 Tax=Halosolutus gelatinilyticus TaxID=2931975 RepID=UPI001FF3CF12|nr:hypothetical protein [Halosolutus gelatinilyticus]